MQQIIEDLIKRVELIENRLNLKSFEQLRKEVGARACRYINWLEVPYDAFAIKLQFIDPLMFEDKTKMQEFRNNFAAQNIPEDKMIITSDVKYAIIHNDCKHLIDFNLFPEIRRF